MTQSPWLAAVDAALRLARRDAEEIASATHTAIIQVADGQVVRVFPKSDEPVR